MQFLAVFISQCLSAGASLKPEQDKEYNFQYCNQRWVMPGPQQGWRRNPEDALVHTERDGWPGHWDRTLRCQRDLKVLWHSLLFLKPVKNFFSFSNEERRLLVVPVTYSKGCEYRCLLGQNNWKESIIQNSLKTLCFRQPLNQLYLTTFEQQCRPWKRDIQIYLQASGFLQLSIQRYQQCLSVDFSVVLRHLNRSWARCVLQSPTMRQLAKARAAAHGHKAT